MSSSQHFTIIFPNRNPRLLLADINNVNAAGFILWGWWFAHGTGRRPGQRELQTGAVALRCQGWLVRRGAAGRRTPLLHLLGLPHRRGWPPTCGHRTNLWPLLCFPTRSREHAHKSEAQRKAVINKFISGRKKAKVDSGPVPVPCTKCLPTCRPPPAPPPAS